MIMGLLPPWVVIRDGSPCGYRIIFEPPRYCGGYRVGGIQIDFQRLILQWVIVGFVIGGLLVTSKSGKSKQEQKPAKESARSEENQKAK